MGPCAKQRVVCTIHLVDGTTITGENVCLTPQAQCPRKPGEGYEKCFTVCSTIGHAEDVALRQLRYRGLGSEDVRAVIGYGHVGPCDACRRQLGSMGLLPVLTFNPEKPSADMSQETIDSITAAYHLGDAQTHQVFKPQCDT